MMTKVICNLEGCIHCKYDDHEGYVCQANTIELYSDHVSYGGCDYGCVIPREEEEEEE